MSSRRNVWVFGGGLAILFIIAPDLWREFHEPGQTAWNIALGVMLVALVAAAIFGQLYLLKHAVDVGEARFDTRNEDER